MFREHIIKEYVKDKDVLDVGSVGQTDEYSLWGSLEAKSLTGIDVVPSINKDIVTGNMETYFFGKRFDVIIMGDVIEHSNNQGLLLKNAKDHLFSYGKLIITTPNAKWWTVFLPNNPTHTLWHDKNTLKTILTRHGFKITKLIYYCGNKNKYNFLIRLLAWHKQILVVCEVK